MFGVGVGIRVGGFTPSGGGGFDPDAQAFFDRVTTAGGTLTTTEQNATNQLVLDMKSAGVWTAMKAIYPMVGASAAACAQNLKSSSFTGSFTSGWTFASTGVTPNGVSAYFDTTLSPSGSLSLNSVNMSFYCRSNVAAGSQVDIGSIETLGKLYSYLNDGGSTYFRINHVTSESNISVGGSSQKNYIFNRTTSTTESVFLNSTKTSFSKTTSAIPTAPIYIGAANDVIFGGARFFSTKQCAFASIGDGLTDTQASNFYTAVQAFQTTLSRNV